MDHKNSFSASYAAAGVAITAGYRAVELMKKHVARTRNEAAWMMWAALAVASACPLPVWKNLCWFPVQTAVAPR